MNWAYALYIDNEDIGSICFKIKDGFRTKEEAEEATKTYSKGFRVSIFQRRMPDWRDWT